MGLPARGELEPPKRELEPHISSTSRSSDFADENSLPESAVYPIVITDRPFTIWGGGQRPWAGSWL